MVLKRKTETIILDPRSIRIELGDGDKIKTIENPQEVLDYITKHGAPEEDPGKYRWVDKESGTVIQDPCVIWQEKGGYETVQASELPKLMEHRAYANGPDRAYAIGSAEDMESGEPNRIFLAGDYDEHLFLQKEVRAREAAEARTVTDSLTGLHSRAYFDDLLPMAVAQARRKRQHLSLIIIDVNRFKEVNDIDGHPAGDQTLRDIADVLKGVLREADVAFRTGGDELALLFRDTDLKTAGKIAERLRDNLEEKAIPHPKDQLVTASIGVAEYPWDASTAEELYQAADDAAKESKKEFRRLTSYFRFDLKARPFQRPHVPSQITLARKVD